MDVKSIDYKIGNKVLFINEIREISTIHNDNTIRLKDGNTSIGCYSVDEIQDIKLTNKNIQELGFNNLGRFYKYPQLFQCVHDREGLFIKFRNLDIPLQIRYYHELQNIINDLKL